MNIYKHLVKAGCALSLTALISACGAGDGDAASAETQARDNFDSSTMLLNLADNLFIPSYQQFSTNSEQFASNSGSLAQYCNAIGSSDEASTQASAREAWRDLMNEWQQAELFIIGPAANNALRDRIYVYGSNATVSTCGIDQVVVLNQQSNFNVSERPNSIRGLAALEYLLFNDDLTHTCPSQVLETQDWDSRSEEERRQWRCDYAQTLASDLNQNANNLLQALKKPRAFQRRLALTILNPKPNPP